MPYKTIADLPKRVHILPKGAKEIFRKAFNSAYKQYNKEEVRAFKVAWAAVKKVYKKTEKGWIKK